MISQPTTPPPRGRILEPLAILMALLAIGWLDHLTGREFSFTDFYLIPLLWSSWRFGRRGAWFCAGAASAIEVAADLSMGRVHSEPWILLWDFFAEYLIFGIVGELLTRLRVSLEHEKALARTDPLTGLSNRRNFNEALSTEIVRSVRYRRAFTLAMLDLDHFKEVNDTQGHKTGDRVLQAVAEVLRAQVRTTDLPARIGGDEFAILFPETDERGARQMVPELHRRLTKAMKESHWPVTVSIGAVTFHRAPKDLEHVLAEADKKLYQVKEAGRNGIAFGRH